MTNKEKYCKCIKNIKRFFRYCIVDYLKRIYHFILFLFCIESKKEENKSHELLKLEENSDIKNLKENLNKYLKDSSSKGFAISIKGNWGVGKTFFWNIYVKENLDEKNYVYVSLFGINKLEDIKIKILNKVSKQANIINKTKGLFGTSRILGVDIGAVISAFGVKNFKEIVVCFDDFERLSPNLNISEVLGVISELKEQYSCKIVIINNNDQLEELDRLNRNIIFTKNQETHRLSLSKTNNNEIFKKYLEKIVNIELEYTPTVENQTSIILNNYKNINSEYVEYANKLFNEINNQNIKTNLRIIEKYFYALELLKDFLEEKKLEDLQEIKDELKTKIFNIVLKEEPVIKPNTKCHLNEFYIKSIIDKNILNISEEYKFQFLEDLEIGRIYIENDKKKKKDEEEKREKDKKLAEEYEKNEEYKKKIEETYSRYISDLDYDKDTFIKEFYELLKGQENIIEFTYFNRFTFFIKDCLIVLDKTKEDEFKKFYIEKAKKYFDTRYKNMERYFFQQAYFLDGESRNELFDYYNGLKKGDIEVEKQEIYKLDIFDTMAKVIKQESNNTEERMLDNISKQEHKRRLEKDDSPYFKTTFDLMIFLKDSHKLKNLENFYNTTLEIYKDLYKDKDYKYRDKIRLILKDFGIDTKELDKVVEESGKE